VTPTATDRIEYAAFRVLRTLLTALPEPVSRWIGSVIGWIAGVLVGVRRGVVRENLRIAFPDLGRAERRRIARRSWAHLGREAVATFLLGAETRESVRSRIDGWEGFDAFEARVREGGGAIAVTGHFGNWEMAGAAVASRGLHVDAVATTQRNPLFNHDLVESRADLGMVIVPRDEAPRRILRGLRAGHVAGIVGDQNVAVGGIHVNFMGRPAVTARGAAVFALRTGSPLYVGLAVALPGPRWRYRFSIEEVTIEPSGDFDEDVRRLTQAHTDVLEKAVRAHPEQYFWPHKRWKERTTTQ
jgi:KDO2-lipid IV(A) lauroyltransferase